MMKISELCRRANVSKELIRHYEELGLIKATTVAAGTRHYRDFDEQTLTRLELITIGKCIGFSLREIKPLLDAYLSDGLTREEMKGLLKTQHHKLSLKIREMENVMQLIEHKLQCIE